MKETNRIKNIIFDFGGVIIDIDFWLSINAFEKLGATDFERIYSQSKQTGIFDRLDKGLISENDFFRDIHQLLPKQITTQQIIDAWNAILIGIPEHRIRLLEKIKTQYRIFLMSNTNRIHYDEYIRELKQKYGYNNLSELFEKVYLSFELKMRKPEQEFFKLILDENGLIASETLFIDDSEQNLPPAKALGIKTLLLQKGTDVTEMFENGFLKSL